MRPAATQQPHPIGRRRYERYVIDLRVTAYVFRDGKTVSTWGRSTELGIDGIGVTLTEELAPDEVVTLELALPLSATPVKFRALVRFRNGLRHGLEFLALAPEQRSLLQRVCEMLAISK